MRRFAVVIHSVAAEEAEAVERYYRQTGEAASTGFNVTDRAVDLARFL